MKNRILAPSILSADFADLRSSVKKIEDNADVVHFDVMDGQFVPEVSFGQVVLRSIRPLTKLPFDVHLMVDAPERQIESFAKDGADWITFHYENTVYYADVLLKKIKSLGKKAGISIKPKTPVCALEKLLSLADIILVMSVEPGFGGQKLIPECLEKITKLVKMRSERNLKYKVSIDGGVNGTTLNDVLQSGVDIIISGSSFFNDTLNWK